RRHDSGMDMIWDNQFRLHLRNVYKLLGAKSPSALFKPILESGVAESRRLPQGLIAPKGLDDPAWRLAGLYEVGGGFGALHKPVEVGERVFWGSAASRLHVRVDSPMSPEQLAQAGVGFWLYLSGAPGGEEVGESFATPLRPAAIVDLGFEPGTVARLSDGELTVARLNESRTGAVPVATEPAPAPSWFSVPFGTLERSGGEPIQMAVVVTLEDRDVEHVPPIGSLGLRVPRSAAPAGGVGRPLRVLIAAAEVAPFAKAGGVADVTSALAKELHRQGHDVRLVLPRYRQVSSQARGLQEALTGLRVPLGDQSLE